MTISLTTLALWPAARFSFFMVTANPRLTTFSRTGWPERSKRLVCRLACREWVSALLFGVAMAPNRWALLGDDGAVHIVAHGQLDTRPFTAADVSQTRHALEAARP